jgi:hypothetical protein
MRWVWHVACIGEMRNVHRILVRKPERDCSEDLSIDGKIILERILGKYGGKVWTE